ncbi:MAG: hypothetical protein U9N82_13535 [Thermodesulfobacteriota bacterium]|nr:hypothetical protein [Thermodesulfobacteriota bacterium]
MYLFNKAGFTGIGISFFSLCPNRLFPTRALAKQLTIYSLLVSGINGVVSCFAAALPAMLRNARQAGLL